MIRTVTQSIELCDRCRRSGLPDERVLSSSLNFYDTPEPEHSDVRQWQLCAECTGQLVAWLNNPLKKTGAEK